MDDLIPDVLTDGSLSPRVGDAARFAVERHGGQLRKGTDLPYATHPIGVAMVLVRTYGPDGADDSPLVLDDLVVAALLHDLLEDTDTTLDEIRDRFGEPVARLVHLLTKPRGAAKARVLADLWTMLATEPDAARVKLADAIHNATCTATDLAADGPAVWGRFGGTPGEKVDYYATIAERAGDGLRDVSGAWRSRGDETLVRTLLTAVDDLRRLLPDRTDGSAEGP